MKENRTRESTCKGILALAFVIAIVGLPLVMTTPCSRNQQGTTTPQILRLEATGSQDHRVYCLGNLSQIGTLSIVVSDSSSGERIGRASVSSTETPSGQPQLSNLTLDDGSVTFTYMLTGSYTFEVIKFGYSTTILGTYLYAGQTETIAIALSKRTHVDVPAPSIMGTVLLTSSFLFLAILLLRRASRNDIYDEGVPTYSYEIASRNEVRSESSQEPNEPVPSLRFCPYCGVTYVRAGASYCWNCGGDLVGDRVANANQGRTRRSPTTVGQCMVCNLDIREDESIVLCRYCRNIAHRNHMLQWLRNRSYCPYCYRHLDERDLRAR